MTQEFAERPPGWWLDVLLEDLDEEIDDIELESAVGGAVSRYSHTTASDDSRNPAFTGSHEVGFDNDSLELGLDDEGLDLMTAGEAF